MVYSPLSLSTILSDLFFERTAPYQPELRACIGMRLRKVVEVGLVQSRR